jgi:FAD/FMN-containing dehydrogenase/Fe-S oxidoreductase
MNAMAHLLRAKDDTRALESDLRSRMAGEVHFDAGARALYSADASNYRQVPIGIVRPMSVDDAVAAVATCAEHSVPVLHRGGGTSMAGQGVNTAVVIDWSRHLNHVLSIEPEAKLAMVEPGCVLDTLRRAAGGHGLTFGPDPATHDHCTLGGMIGNNSCGVHSLMAGRTSENVERLEILTYDGLRMWVGATGNAQLQEATAAHGRRGEIYRGLVSLRDGCADEVRRRFPDIPRRVAGYSLDELLPERGLQVARALVGTEGTCVSVLRAEVRLVDDPPERALVVFGFPDVGAAGDAVGALLETGPIGLEGFDHALVDDARAKGMSLPGLQILPDAGAWLMVEFGGSTSPEAQAKARKAMAALPGSGRLVEEAEHVAQLWDVRESALGATARLPSGAPTWSGWEDSAVPPARVGDYLRDLLGLYQRYGYHAAVYGHFGGGCIHNRLDFDLTSAGGIATYRSFAQEAADLVVSYGGSISGEHGDGQSRAELLPRMFGAALVEAFGQFKAIWDPGNAMNPGKVVHPHRLDEDLRLGAGYHPADPPTSFAYSDDQGSFGRAALRCVGVGKCRKEDAGTMCPSYMATREERYSTRGRARLLFEMLQGDVIRDGWSSEAVRDALDLCLACKACKSECPVNVDMATYKAEFLAQHYRRRLRPPAHYSMGWLPLLGRAASRSPRLANALSHARGLASVAKWAGGIAPERDLPRFAGETFVGWFERRGGPRPGRTPVLLWADTFTNYFHPQAGRAAVRVLERAGFRVHVLHGLCCGLTWISTGQLGMAKRVLRHTVAVLAPALQAGVPVVCLEPSCAAVFRSDLCELLPGESGARELARQTRSLADLLVEEVPGFRPPPWEAKAIVQNHCHQRAVLGTASETRVLQAMGLDVEVLDSGCCGLAGNFGFERGHYGVSMACAERVLLPAVRRAGPGTLVVADGFSCRTQIEQATGRRALHLAEVLDLASQQAGSGPAR